MNQQSNSNFFTDVVSKLLSYLVIALLALSVIIFLLVSIMLLVYGIALAPHAHLLGAALIMMTLSFFTLCLAPVINHDFRQGVSACLIAPFTALFGLSIPFIFIALVKQKNLLTILPWIPHVTLPVLCAVLAFILCALLIGSLCLFHLTNLFEEDNFKTRSMPRKPLWRIKGLGSSLLSCSIIGLGFFQLLQCAFLGGGTHPLALMLGFATLFAGIFHQLWGLLQTRDFAVWLGPPLLSIAVIVSSVALASGALSPFLHLVALTTLILSSLPVVHAAIFMFMLIKKEEYNSSKISILYTVFWMIAYMLSFIQSAVFNAAKESYYSEYCSSTVEPGLPNLLKPCYQRYFKKNGSNKSYESVLPAGLSSRQGILQPHTS